MKKVFVVLLLVSSFLFAGVKTVNVNPEIVQSGIKIIDIRTQGEWLETGIVKDSIPLTFFDERGNYDAENFINTLNSYIKQNEEFAIICRTGNRTTAVSDFLGKNGYSVINLKGGIKRLTQQGYKLKKYNKVK